MERKSNRSGNRALINLDLLIVEKKRLLSSIEKYIVNTIFRENNGKSRHQEN